MNNAKVGKDFWGTYVWTCIHLLAVKVHNHPELSKFFKIFMYSLLDLLPCIVPCRINLRKHLYEMPINDEDLFFWTYILHDKASPNNISPSYDLVRHYYFSQPTDFINSYAMAVIHIFAVTYDPKYSRSYKMFISSLENLVPSLRLKLILPSLSIDTYLSSNENLFFWTYLVHSKYNKLIGKKMPSYEDMKRFYYFKVKDDTCKECNL